MSDHRLKCPDCHRPTEPIESVKGSFRRRCVAVAECGWRGDRTDTLKPDGEGGWVSEDAPADVGRFHAAFRIATDAGGSDARLGTARHPLECDHPDHAINGVQRIVPSVGVRRERGYCGECSGYVRRVWRGDGDADADSGWSPWRLKEVRET